MRRRNVRSRRPRVGLHVALMALLALTATVLAGIYPPGHFDTSTKLTEKNFDAHVKEQVDAGKTLFVRWIASEG